jgi:hypothetical protein
MLRSYIVGMKLLCVLLLLSSSMCAQAAHDDVDRFDKPSKMTRDFGPSPYYAATYHVRKKLTCYIYPSFMVKEYDEGQKGAEWLSILRFDPGSRPACSLAHLKGEKVIKQTRGADISKARRTRLRSSTQRTERMGDYPSLFTTQEPGGKSSRILRV